MADTDDFERDLAEIGKIAEEHGFTLDMDDDDESIEEIESLVALIGPDDPKLKEALAKVRRLHEWRKSKRDRLTLQAPARLPGLSFVTQTVTPAKGFVD
jgi:hypothetical protein